MEEPQAQSQLLQMHAKHNRPPTPNTWDQLREWEENENFPEFANPLVDLADIVDEYVPVSPIALADTADEYIPVSPIVLADTEEEYIPVSPIALADPYEDFTAPLNAIERELNASDAAAATNAVRLEAKPAIVRRMPSEVNDDAERPASDDVIQLESDEEEDPDEIVVLEPPPPPPLPPPIMIPLHEALFYINNKEAEQRNALMKMWKEMEDKKEAEKRKEEEERKKKEKEEEDEKKRKSEESIRLEVLHAQAENAEKDAEREVEKRTKNVDDFEKLRAQQRRELAVNLNAASMNINRLRTQITQEEKRMVDMRAEDAARDSHLAQERRELEESKKRVKTKKEERMAAAVEVDDAEHSQTLRYSRACSICLTPNPRRRAVFVACGHQTCVNCADKLDRNLSGSVSCPFCRKSGTYVKLFEDLETPEAGQETRKRANSDSDDASSSKRRRPHVNDNEFISLVNTLFPPRITQID